MLLKIFLVASKIKGIYNYLINISFENNDISEIKFTIF